MQFVKLRLSGFKSFVEPAELRIDPGLTGIVGPNGCGKSNLVEALRWVMGENSPKRLRGSAMDDVIFGGTALRPARNLAEVLLALDNQDRSASAEFNDSDQLEVTRRITRDEGSDYRINGRPVRMRDVHTLFADQATGAHATAIVSQGQIGLLVTAKPQERRQLLEEAAGITGLHARRHDAELRLKAAEGNLTRAEDVLQGMESQLRGLKLQARQAARYRSLSERLRAAEGGLLAAQAQDVAAVTHAAHQQLETSNAAVAAQTTIVTGLTAARTEQAAGLPEFRSAEAAAAVQLQRLSLQAAQLEAEEQRLHQELNAAADRLRQLEHDLAREKTLADEARDQIAQLTSRQQALQEAGAGFTGQQAEAEAAIAGAGTATQEAERNLAAQSELAARNAASLSALRQEQERLAERLRVLTRRRVELAGQQEALAQALVTTGAMAGLADQVAIAEAQLQQCQQAGQQAEIWREKCEIAERQARSLWQEASSARTRLRAEAETIRTLLQADAPQWPPVLDQLSIRPGYETAVAAGLGEALLAPTEATADAYWYLLTDTDDQPLPAGCACLADCVTAPAELGRALRQIGVVADRATGDQLQAALRPGQVLVTMAGQAWRWDGYRVTQHAQTAVAQRLEQRARLQVVREQLRHIEQQAETAESLLAAAIEETRQAIVADRAARTDLATCFQQLDASRSQYGEQAEWQARTEAQQQAVRETLASLQEEITATEQRAALLAREITDLAAVQIDEPALDGLRARVAERRTVLRTQQDALAALLAREQQRCQQLAEAQQQQVAWEQRAEAALQRIEALAVRKAETQHQWASFADKPAQLAAQRAALTVTRGAAEQIRQQAADALLHAENQLRDTEAECRRAEAVLATQREERVRAEAAVAAAALQMQLLDARCQEKFNQPLAAFLAGLPSVEPQPIAKHEADVARLLREREQMGPVNLVAEAEATKLEEDIARLVAERDDLVAAIAKLRGGIGSLNREARERLLTAFASVNTHFQRLFTQLFGGGKAYLQFIEGDDPLEAGLEIFASPPGKKLQVLSLLSGGEKALTALALLFAVFLTNPAPICVLDEVDAPLDEANIGRFCDLVEQIARGGHTRFLVITHQRHTMARMDRLFGVTMQEKGISTLVSVDLQQAEALRDTPLAQSAAA